MSQNTDPKCERVLKPAQNVQVFLSGSPFFTSPGTGTGVLSNLVTASRIIESSRLEEASLAMKDYLDSPDYSVDDDDDDDACERGLCLQRSNDTASLTLRSSSSTETVLVEDEDVVASPSHLRRRQQRNSIPTSPAYRDSLYPDDDVSFDDDDKKQRSIEIYKYLLQQQRKTVVKWIFVATLTVACWFVWSPDTPGLFRPRWKLPSRRQAQKLLNKIRKPTLHDGITVRLKGNRIDLLFQSLDQYSRCPSVRDVQIEWGTNKALLPESILYHGSGKVVPVGKPRTDAVFLLDAAIELTCKELERGYDVWKTDRIRLVGFLPLRDGDDRSYSLLSDKAVIIHTLYLESIDTLSVALPMNRCQDFVLSALVAALSLKSPIAMVSNAKTDNKEEICAKQLSQATGLVSLPDTTIMYIGHNIY